MGPSQRTTARWITLLSSETLPSHLYFDIAALEVPLSRISECIISFFTWTKKPPRELQYRLRRPLAVDKWGR